MSIEDVQARIASIQSRFAPPAQPGVLTGSTSGAPALGTSASPAVTAATSASFNAELSKLLGGLPLPAKAGTSGSDVVTGARKYLGVPYVWGGTDPKKGLDCSGLTQKVFGELGVKLPRVSRDQAKVGEAVPNVAAARPGDLVFFESPVNHVGIYVGDNKILHAPRTGGVVRIENIWETPSGIRRVAVAGGAGTVSAGIPVGAAPGAVPRASGLDVPFAGLFEAAAGRHDVSAALLAAVAKVESGFRSGAVSPAGARGLMQLMPGTAKGLGVDPFDPAQAVDGAARLLKRHLKDFGSLDLALAAYNAGPGAVRKYDGIPPYAETRAYVRKVASAMSTLTSPAGNA